MVDVFMNVEQEHLDFIRSNLENVRIESYKDIQETILRGHVTGSSTRKIILSSSLTVSPHYMMNIINMRIKVTSLQGFFNTIFNDMISFIESWKPFGKTVVGIFYAYCFVFLHLFNTTFHWTFPHFADVCWFGLLPNINFKHLMMLIQLFQQNC